MAVMESRSIYGGSMRPSYGEQHKPESRGHLTVRLPDIREVRLDGGKTADRDDIL